MYLFISVINVKMEGKCTETFTVFLLRCWITTLWSSQTPRADQVVVGYSWPDGVPSSMCLHAATPERSLPSSSPRVSVSAGSV